MTDKPKRSLQKFKKEKTFLLKELNNISFGSLEGETDDNLNLDTFFPTQSIRKILKKRYNYILSPKGVGKSAFFSAIKHNYMEGLLFKREKYSIIPINKAFGNEDENLDPEKFNEDENRKNYAVYWGLYLATELIKDILDKHGDKDNFTAFKKKISKIEGLKDKFQLFNTIELLNQLNLGLTFNVSGQQIEISPTVKLDRPLEKLNLNSVFEQIDEFYRENELTGLVMIDRIDSFVSKEKQSIQKNYVQGIIDCVEEITVFKNIRCLVFLRTDLFNSFDIKFEYDKVKERKIELKWEEYETLNFIIFRLIYNPYVFENFFGYFKEYQDEASGKKTDAGWFKSIINWCKKQTKYKQNKKLKKKDIPFKVAHKFLSMFFHNRLPDYENKDVVDWILEDFKDSNGFVNPRMLIYFFNQLFERQAEHCRNNLTEDKRESVPLISNAPSYFQIFSNNVIIGTFNHLREEEVRNINKLLRSKNDQKLFKEITEVSKEKGFFKIGDLNIKKLDIEREELESLLKYLQLLGFCSVAHNDKQKFLVPLIYQFKLN